MYPMEKCWFLTPIQSGSPGKALYLRAGGPHHPSRHLFSLSSVNITKKSFQFFFYLSKHPEFKLYQATPFCYMKELRNNVPWLQSILNIVNRMALVKHKLDLCKTLGSIKSHPGREKPHVISLSFFPTLPSSSLLPPITEPRLTS